MSMARLLIATLCVLLLLLVLRPGFRQPTFDAEPAARPLDRQHSPRRPMPDDHVIYEVDLRGPKANSQGTAFVIDHSGIWITAAHGTRGCARIALVDDSARARPVSSIMEARGKDITLILDGMRAPASFPLSTQRPPLNSVGYHMGFPAGEPVMVESRLMGTAGARNADGTLQPMLAWAETGRSDRGNGPLEGISGAPVITADGHVVGVLSAVSERRGRILTVAPEAVGQIVSATRAGSDRPTPAPIDGSGTALSRFYNWLSRGMIRQVHCDI